MHGRIVTGAAMAMIEALGIESPGPAVNGTTADRLRILGAQETSGQGRGSEYSQKNVHTLDRFRLRRNQGIVLLNGGRFEAREPNGRWRGFLDICPTEAYGGHRTWRSIGSPRGYRDDFEASKRCRETGTSGPRDSCRGAAGSEEQADQAMRPADVGRWEYARFSWEHWARHQL